MRLLPPKPKRIKSKKAELEFRDSTIYLDYDSDPEEKEKKPETPVATMNRVQQMLAKVPTPPVSLTLISIIIKIIKIIMTWNVLNLYITWMSAWIKYANKR